MSRPTFRVFAARWWEWRPGSSAVLVMTGATVLMAELTGWPAWLCVLLIIVITAALGAAVAALELHNEAAQPKGVDDSTAGLAAEAGEP